MPKCSKAIGQLKKHRTKFILQQVYVSWGGKQENWIHDLLQHFQRAKVEWPSSPVQKKAKWDKTNRTYYNVALQRSTCCAAISVGTLGCSLLQVFFLISGDTWPEIRIVLAGWLMAVDLQRWKALLGFCRHAHPLGILKPRNHIFAIDCQHTHISI